MTIIACDCSADIDCGEQCDFSCVEERVARKPHECCECHETIRPGTRYRINTCCYDGKIERCKTCLPCARIRKWYCPGGWYPGELAEQLIECEAIGFDYREAPGPDEAEEIDREDARRVAEHNRRTG
jgi:hypothetical protein